MDTQRTYYKRGKILPERTAKLEGIGFAWKMKKGREVSARAQFGSADERSYDNAGRRSDDSTTKPALLDSSGHFPYPELPPLQDFLTMNSTSRPLISQARRVTAKNLKFKNVKWRNDSCGYN